ncbi:MAG TPA: glycosyltransferase family 2 protein [Planctomycetota bacterium]|nr:glycosyltransferase family 2 protein [Planctomycetota bacterium]
MKLTVVVLNWRTPALTIDCLRSLEPELAGLPSARVIVTDNASGDDSIERIGAAIRKNGWEPWAQLMPLPKNGGFSYGNNAAIRAGLAETPPVDAVLLLNPDTVVRPRAIQALVEFMARHPKVGLVGSRLENPDGTPQVSAFRFHSALGEFESTLGWSPVTKLLRRWVIRMAPVPEPCPVDWVAGASLLIRREVFESIGLLDERYFLYYEEVDFCLRARRAGWPCWYEPASRVVHLVGQATGVTNQSHRNRRPRYWFDSRRRYFVKNHGKLYASLTDGLWWIGLLARRIRCVAEKKHDSGPPWLLRDAISNGVFSRGFGL